MDLNFFDQSFKNIENEVMRYITRNPKKFCKYTEIFSDIVTEYNIRNPEVLLELKNKLNIVMRLFDSTFKNVHVIKQGNSYSVAYNADIIDLTDSKLQAESSSEIIDQETKDMKSMFEYMIDNNIDYNYNKPDYNGENLLFLGVRLNDSERVRKLLFKETFSFYSQNKEMTRPFDLIPTTMLKLCIEENHNEILALKQEIIALKQRNNNLSMIIIDINKQLTVFDKIIQTNDANNYLYYAFIIIAIMCYYLF